MNIKKGLKVLGIIIIILLVALVVYTFAIHFDGFLSKDNPMTRNEIIKLLEKGKEYSNYYYSSNDKILFLEINNGSKTESFIKDNIVKCVVNGETIEWINYETRENIRILGEHEGQKIAAIDSLDNKNMERNEDSQEGFDYSIISEEEIYNNDFEYLGEKEIDRRATIIVKVWNRDNLKINSTKYYIDKETGLIMRRVDYSLLGLVKINCDRNVKMDIVTDKDVERPNLEGYKILQYN